MGQLKMNRLALPDHAKKYVRKLWNFLSNISNEALANIWHHLNLGSGTLKTYWFKGPKRKMSYVICISWTAQAKITTKVYIYIQRETNTKVYIASGRHVLSFKDSSPQLNIWEVNLTNNSHIKFAVKPLHILIARRKAAKSSLMAEFCLVLCVLVKLWYIL